MVAVCGVSIATIAMVCAMSVFGGLQDFVSQTFSRLDPELKITAKTGKTFDAQVKEIDEVRNMKGIAVFSEILEDNVMLEYNGRQLPSILKGVHGDFAQLTEIDSILFDGEFKLKDEVNYFGTIGINLAMKIGTGAGFSYPITVHAVKRKERVNPANPAQAFSTNYIYISGVFRTNQEIYDNQLLIAPIELTRDLFDYETEVSSIEIKLSEGVISNQIQSDIQKILGDQYTVQNRYQQQETTFRMMEIEKWVTFLILVFICLIAVFNVVSTLSMLIVEKKEDIYILRNLGADNKLISRIFLFEGWMVSILGAVSGIIIGLLLCFLQQQFGWLKLGGYEGVALVEAYPVVISFSDIFYIFITVVTIGFLAALYPARYLSNRWLK